MKQLVNATLLKDCGLHGSCIGRIAEKSYEATKSDTALIY
jgi:hypothetical protein